MVGAVAPASGNGASLMTGASIQFDLRFLEFIGSGRIGNSTVGDALFA